jgi:hypothetical protein
MSLYSKYKFLFIVATISFLAVFPISAEYTIQPIIGRNGGDFVFETGSRFPNLSGIRAGSRISFERDFNLFGFGGKYFNGPIEFYGKFTTTGWSVPTGKARDEDFVLFTTSTERAHHINTREFSFYDTTSVFGGQRNFADGIGKSSMSEYNFDFLFRYYFGKSTPDIQKSGDGYYLSAGARYTYNKYKFYDVVQWIGSNPIFYQPIGFGLSFTNSIFEIPFGIGYRWNWEKFYLDTTLHGLFAFYKTRDFHVQRNINFNSETFGPGVLAQIETGYKMDNRSIFFLRMNQHRSFTKGTFAAVGGLTEQDILANFLGRYKAHINTKQFSVEFGFDYRPEWGNSSDRDNNSKINNSVPKEDHKSKEEKETSQEVIKTEEENNQSDYEKNGDQDSNL